MLLANNQKLKHRNKRRMGGNRLNIYGFLINMRILLYDLNMLIKPEKAYSIADKDLQRIGIVDIDNFPTTAGNFKLFIEQRRTCALVLPWVIDPQLNF